MQEQNRSLRERFYDFPYDLLAFGDDGCGEPFCTSENDSRVACWYPIEGEARIVASNLNDFWRGWATGTLKF
ncbi:MAG: SMI1/KNR4 family protein [Mycobacteriaceae bacterium]